MKYAVACLLFVNAFGVIVMPAQLSTRFSGAVYLADGSPAEGEEVVFYPYSPYSGVRLATRTNTRGEFVLVVPHIGRGLISASNTIEGYPDAASAFYRLSDYKSVQERDSDEPREPEIRLEFNQPAPRIELTIKPHGSSPAAVQIRVTSNIRTNVFSTSSWDPSQVWRFVVPKDSITITVSAPGAGSWSYTTDSKRIPVQGILNLVAELK
jgi:hypothetical protein